MTERPRPVIAPFTQGGGHGPQPPKPDYVLEAERIGWHNVVFDNQYWQGEPPCGNGGFRLGIFEDPRVADLAAKMLPALGDAQVAVDQARRLVRALNQ